MNHPADRHAAVADAAPTVPIRKAASVLLVRDAAPGLQVLMLRRTESAVFLGGAYVFPGGGVDEDDGNGTALQRMTGLSPTEADTRLHLPSGALAYWHAAARECFEEAGILLALREDRAPPDAGQMARALARRDAINAGASFDALLAEEGLVVDASAMVYLDHWITPALRTRRFDTRFFLAQAPFGQEGTHDNNETIASEWMTPRDALERGARRTIDLTPVTQVILQGLQPFATVEAALHAARALVDIETKRPIAGTTGQGTRLYRPGDAPYHELHWADPGESATMSGELVPGVVARLDAHVTRITASNPGMMTGPGTNTYLVGTRELAVIDPGPLIPAHLDAILAAGAGRIRWILCTHTHRDHSPAAMALKAATGATIIGHRAPPGMSQDETFRPDHEPASGEALALGDVTLRALHTPGHASNHLCYLLVDTGMLFTGDHVMQGSTVVIGPPDGDMQAYLRSLDALLAIDIAIIAPGHGFLIGKPHHEVRALIAHRLRREAKVLAGIDRLQGGTLEELVPIVYADVDERMWPVAARSLLAHLGKLIADGVVAETGGRYVRV